MQASAGDFILGEVRFDFVKNLFLFVDLFLNGFYQVGRIDNSGQTLQVGKYLLETLQI